MAPARYYSIYILLLRFNTWTVMILTMDVKNNETHAIIALHRVKTTKEDKLVFKNRSRQII